MRGVYPGTFNPPTVAHVAVARAAVEQAGLSRLDLVVSRVSLGKEALDDADERAAALRTLGFDVVVSDHQLLADIAAGYDALVLGADKWAQVVDPSFYGGSSEARDTAVARLPRLIVAPRPPFDVPEGALVLQLPSWVAEVSSTSVRGGRVEWRASAP